MFELQKGDIKLYNYSNNLCSLHAGFLSYIKKNFEQYYSFQWRYVLYIDLISFENWNCD